MSSLEEHIEKLNCPDEAERIYAAEDIGYLNSSDGVPALSQRLSHEPSRAVREAIFQAFIRIEADAAIEVCIGLLNSEDSQLRNQAVDVLRHKGAAAFPFLAAVMREGDKDLRKLVLDILSEVDFSGAEAIYEAALSDPDMNVVITAVENTAKMRAVQFRQQIEEILSTASQPMLIRRNRLEALGGIGDQSSLSSDPPPLPLSGGGTGLTCFLLPESFRCAGIGCGVRRSSETAASLRSSASPRHSRRSGRDSTASQRRGPGRQRFAAHIAVRG